ncbi:hypothetical protein GCM10022243_54480 [Saccharothrix violaceirubra]|uniref:Uncharacterized protein n=1 Tax=Saccharothrix violaceirubra TaxID=413306 RepID=A0A7W7WXB9_9PSEU|nr:contact-dependent growth inhibition system immunity protein [Saccharothrix violaceirubra]MBB4966961.1 hypothetical protein [Saccharothrix violaceirubra]
MSDKLSIEELDGERWPEPARDAPREIAVLHALRRKPVRKLTAGDLRLLLLRDVGVEHVLPRAVDLLRVDPLVNGGHYDGDLLFAVVTRDHAVWTRLPEIAAVLRTVVTEAGLPARLHDDVDAFLDATR